MLVRRRSNFFLLNLEIYLYFLRKISRSRDPKKFHAGRVFLPNSLVSLPNTVVSLNVN